MENATQTQLDAACAKHNEQFNKLQALESRWIDEVRAGHCKKASTTRSQADMMRTLMRVTSDRIINLKLDLMNQNA